MKRIITLLSVFWLIGSFTFITAQGKVYPLGQTLEKAKIFTMDNKNIVVNNLTFLKDSITYEEKNSGNLVSKSLNDFYLVQRYVGNETVLWGALLGLSAAAGALAGVLEAQASNPGTSINAAPFVLGFGVVGVIIGAIIGSGIEKWETVYSK